MSEESYRVRDLQERVHRKQAENTRLTEELHSERKKFLKAINDQAIKIASLDLEKSKLQGALEGIAKREPGDFCDCDLIARKGLGYDPRKATEALSTAPVSQPQEGDRP